MARSRLFFMISFVSFTLGLLGDLELEKETFSNISFLSAPPCRGHLAGGRGGGGCEGCGRGCGRDSKPAAVVSKCLTFSIKYHLASPPGPRGSG